MKYRAEIDGLRAIAVIPVILFHAGVEFFSGGFLGVDIFFVISGYLITTLLHENLQNGDLNLRYFYERRARRLLPAILVVVLACIPFAWFWMLPSQLKDFSQSLVATNLFASNVLFWLESGYFETASEQKPLLHTWSLAVEEQFYLFFPLLLAVIWTLGKHRIIGILGFIAFLSLASSVWGGHSIPNATFFLIPFRLWELLAGAIAAQVAMNWRLRQSELLSTISFAAIIISLAGLQRTMQMPGLITLLPVLGTVGVILFAGSQTRVGRLLSIKPLVAIGLISYSAYLWHQPLFAFSRIKMIEPPSQLLLVSLSFVTLGLAYLTWRWIEQPFRNPSFQMYQSTPRFLMSCLFIITLITGFGFVGHLTDGYKHRFTEALKGDVGQTTFHQIIDENYLDCEPAEIAATALRWEGFLRCKQSQSGPLDWILLGDSHAEHLFLGLAEFLPEKNIGFYIQNEKPYLHVPQFQQIFSTLSDTPPATILLTMYYAPRLQQSNDLMQNFAKVIEYLKVYGHEVILLGDIPDFKADPELCKLDNGYQSFSGYCREPKSNFDRKSASYEPVLRKLADDYGIPFIPIHAPLCEDTHCSMVGPNTVLYRDSNHLNLLGSRLVGEYIGKQISYFD